MPRPDPLSLPAPPPSLPAHQGIRARDQLHRHLEEAIAEKLHEDTAGEPGDALAMIIHSTRELGHELSVQELKVGGARSLLPSCSPRGSVSTLSLSYSSGRGGKDQASGRGSARPTLRGSLEGLSPRLFWTQTAPLPSPSLSLPAFTSAVLLTMKPPSLLFSTNPEGSGSNSTSSWKRPSSPKPVLSSHKAPWHLTLLPVLYGLCVNWLYPYSSCGGGGGNGPQDILTAPPKRVERLGSRRQKWKHLSPSESNSHPFSGAQLPVPLASKCGQVSENRADNLHPDSWWL